MDKAAARFQLECRVQKVESSRHAAATICRHCIGNCHHAAQATDIECESNVCPMYYAREYAIEKCIEANIVKKSVEKLF